MAGKALPTSLVSDRLGCSYQHVRNLFHRGELDGFFKGDQRGLMIYADSLKKFIERDLEQLGPPGK